MAAGAPTPTVRVAGASVRAAAEKVAVATARPPSSPAPPTPPRMSTSTMQVAAGAPTPKVRVTGASAGAAADHSTGARNVVHVACGISNLLTFELPDN